jgi:hypothetical protein
MHTANPPRNGRLNYHGIGVKGRSTIAEFQRRLGLQFKNLNSVGDLKTEFRSNRSEFKLQLHHISIW